MGAAAVVVAAIRLREKQVIRAFRMAAATSPGAAKTPDEMGLDDLSSVKRLRSQAIVRDAAPGKLYLDEEVLRAVRRRRFHLIGVLIVILLLLLVGMRLGIIKS